MIHTTRLDDYMLIKRRDLVRLPIVHCPHRSYHGTEPRKLPISFAGVQQRNRRELHILALRRT